MSRRLSRGFTLVELLVALAVGAMLIAIIYTVFIAQRRGHDVQGQVAESQQNARVAADTLTRAIQGIGNNVDHIAPDPVNWQPQILYCGPYELAFASDTDEDATHGALPPGTALPSTFTGGATLVTTDTKTYVTGAEAHVYALKTTGGRTYRLVRKSFWGTPSSGPTTLASGDEEEIASSLAAKDSGNHGAPLFRYWGYFGTDDKVTLWGDGDENGLLDKGEEDAVTPIPDPINGRHLDQAVVRVEVQVLTETTAPDKAYAANGGYRQTLVKSSVVPRNLGTCPVLTPANANLQKHPHELHGTQSYGFTYTFMGQPQKDKVVAFALSGPAPAPTLVTSSALTDVNGLATAQVLWPDCAAFKANLAKGGKLTYRLTASIAGGGSGCSGMSVDTVIEVTPGPAMKIVATPPATPVNTCPDPSSFTITLRSYEECGIEVDPPAGGEVKLQALDATGATPTPFGVINGFTYPQASPFTVSPQDFTIVLPNNHDGYKDRLRLDAAGNFGVRIQIETVPAWLTDHATLPLTVSVRPYPARSTDWQSNLSFWPKVSSNLLGAALTDCDGPLKDQFHVLDCHEISMYQLDDAQAITGAMIEDATIPEKDQGAISSTNNAAPAARTDAKDTFTVSIKKSSDNQGLFDFLYTPPGYCTLGTTTPTNRVVQYHPTLSLTFPWANPAPTPSSGPLTLTPCANCVLEAEYPLTPCTGKTRISITGCNQNAHKVRLLVLGPAGTGRNGTFEANDPVINDPDPYPQTHLGNIVEWSPAIPVNGTTETTLYIGNSRVGDTLRVTAYYLDPKDPTDNTFLWKCDEITLKITNKCQDMKITKVTAAGTGPMGTGACLFGISSFSFEVDDCQYNPAGVGANGHLTAYVLYVPDPVNAPDTLKIFDLEDLTLTPSGSGFTELLTGSLKSQPWFWAVGWPNGRIDYPINEIVYLYFAYEDRNDPKPVPANAVNPGDNHVPSSLYNKTRGDTLSLATLKAETDATDKCQKLFPTTTPVGMCFNNAISTSGAAAWQGNFEIHWGDVVIMGNGNAPANKMVLKSSTGQLNGSGYSGQYTDRFLDFYTGKSSADDMTTGLINSNPAGTSPTRPYLSSSYGNYVQNLSHNKILSMLQFLDYDAVKSQARGQGVYWYTVSTAPLIYPGSTTIERIRNALSNPNWTPAVDSHPNGYTLQEVLELGTSTNGPTSNTYHTGGLIFIDVLSSIGNEPNPSYTAVAAQANAGTLPTHKLNGGFTQGIIYLAGSLDIQGGNGRLLKNVKPPANQEENYRHNDPEPPWTSCGLPTRPDGSVGPDVDLQVNVHGAVYAVGKFGAGSVGGGNFGIFGAITSEHGFAGAGTPEVWFDENLLNAMGAALCVTCNDPRFSKNCRLDVAPYPDSIAIGIPLTPVKSCGDAGTVNASSSDDSVISVSPASGTVGSTDFTLTAQPGQAGKKAIITFSNPATGCTVSIPILAR